MSIHEKLQSIGYQQKKHPQDKEKIFQAMIITCNILADLLVAYGLAKIILG